MKRIHGQKLDTKMLLIALFVKNSLTIGSPEVAPRTKKPLSLIGKEA